MHIGIDARYLGAANTGLARYSENLLEALARQDTHNQYTVFVHAGLSRRLKLGPNFRLIPMRGQPHSLRAMLALSNIILREGLDLLHTHFPLAPPLIDCPVMITVHDTLPYVPDRNIFSHRLRPWRWLWKAMIYPMSLARAKWVICVSRATRDSLCQLFPAVFNKTVVIHSGINETFLSPIEPATRELIRVRLELPERYILTSGSVRQDKNVDGMLLAFVMLRQRNPAMEDLSLVLDISGEDYSLAPIQRTIRQYGIEAHVRLFRNLGDEERRVLFDDAQLLINLSRSEGFGFPILEAQMCDLPVLIADAGALPEVAGENGAVLVDPDNLEQVVAMLERLLTDDTLRAYLIENGRDNAVRYDWNRTASQLVEIYDLLFYPRELIPVPRRRFPLFRSY